MGEGDGPVDKWETMENEDRLEPFLLPCLASFLPKIEKHSLEGFFLDARQKELELSPS